MAQQTDLTQFVKVLMAVETVGNNIKNNLKSHLNACLHKCQHKTQNRNSLR